MKRTRNRIILVAVGALLCGLALLPLARRLAREAAGRATEVTPADAAEVHDGSPAPAIPSDHFSPMPPALVEAGNAKAALSSPEDTLQLKPLNPSTQAAETASTTISAPRRGKPPAQDPLARVALAFVGEDPWAEAYWYLAINDPSLPPTERQDLIEDLNEDGLFDPKHPTIEDLPLIVSRIWLIEQVGWDAMDQVNADAFAEAYKDLVNLADVALGGGEPVR